MLSIENKPDYSYQVRAVKRLAGYPRVAVSAVGKSLCGRCIYVVRIGHGEPRRLIAAGFHGMEYITVAAALRYAAELAAVGKRLRGSVAVAPCVNPDGTQIAVTTGKRWQANARGVDINHNFDADWQGVRQREIAAGITSPGPTRFGGSSPESEPETRALTDLCRRVRFDRVLALHSQGREIYWDFGKCTPPCCRELAEKMAEAGGYAVATPEPMALGGGFKDWFISEFHRCGYTVEMGLGKNPLPLSDLEAEYPRVRNILNVFVGENDLRII